MTYNSNAPLGFIPSQHVDGSPWNGALRSYPIASAYGTAMYTGDPVAMQADGTIGIGVAGAPIRGVFMGCFYTTAAGIYTPAQYWPASTVVKTGTTAYALVVDDPSVVFDIQETDGSSGAGTPLALADRGLNINFAVGTGSAASGRSGASINNTTEATTVNLNCKIIDLAPRPGNVVGNYANWLVVINNHDLKGGYGTSGT